jgi:hypothetical protein
MTTNPLNGILEALANAVFDETAERFKTWMLEESDAPESVRKQFSLAIDKLDNKELAVIVLSASRWVHDIKAKLKTTDAVAKVGDVEYHG